MSFIQPSVPAPRRPLAPDRRIMGNNRCRTCLNTNVILYPIFTAGTEEVQSKELNIITGDMIKVNDGLPQHMCKDCKLSLTIALQFRKTCNKAQETLLKDLKVKIETPDLEIDPAVEANPFCNSQQNLNALNMLGNLLPQSTLANLYQQQGSLEALNNLYSIIMSTNHSQLGRPRNYPTNSNQSTNQSQKSKSNEINQKVQEKTNNTESLALLNPSLIDKLGSAVTISKAGDNPISKPETNLPNNLEKSTEQTKSIDLSKKSAEQPENLVIRTETQDKTEQVAVKHEFNIEIEIDPTDYLYENNENREWQEISQERLNPNVTVKVEKIDDSEELTNDVESLVNPLEVQKGETIVVDHEPLSIKPEVHIRPAEPRQTGKKKPRVKRKKLDLKNMKCEECNRVFTRVNSYKDHMRFHEVYVECEICGKRHRNIHALGIHKRTQHNFEWIHKCSYCDYRSSTKEGVVVHERTHTGEKPYICDHCGASFHRRALIVQHVDLHSEKNSECPICEKLFSSKRLVRMHIAKTHKANRYDYQCTVCGITLRYSQSVKKHLLKTHGIPRHLKGLILRVPRDNSAVQETVFIKQESATVKEEATAEVDS